MIIYIRTYKLLNSISTILNQIFELLRNKIKKPIVDPSFFIIGGFKFRNVHGTRCFFYHLKVSETKNR
jgi:hypothetical protein